MWVKTGSADETKGEEGISHFIEHLVFKGTEKYGVGAIASTVEAAGGELNAYTSFDQTVFYVNISREFSDIALDVIAEMMGFPKFEMGEIDNEREVVIEEIKRSNDSPGRQGSRLLFSTVFKKHPYGIPVIGFDKLIKKVSRKNAGRLLPKPLHPLEHAPRGRGRFRQRRDGAKRSTRRLAASRPSSCARFRARKSRSKRVHG